MNRDQFRAIQAQLVIDRQIAHHRETGEVITPDRAREMLRMDREVQILLARDDMIRRLDYARRMRGASRAEFVPEPEFEQ